MNDIDQIRMLAARYNFAADAGDREAMLDCYVPEGSFGRTDLGTEFRGRDAIGRMSDAFPVQGRHVTSDHIIEVEADTGTLTCTLLFFNGAKGYTLYMIGTYRDTVVRRDGAWLFLDRRLNADYLAQDDSDRPGGEK
jgi:hypothetical protein